MKTIALRFGEHFAPECGTIAAHQSVIDEYGYVWYGKMGSAVSLKVINDILNNEQPRILLIRSGNKEQFKVILNVLMNLYEASKPEIFEKDWHNDKFAPLAYLYGLFHNTIDDEKINRARLRMAQVLDTSVTSAVAMDEKRYFITKRKTANKWL